MIGETAGAVLERAIATDHAMRGVPRPSGAFIVDETPDTMTDTENQYLTLQDVADRLQLKIRTVRDHETRGILPASRLGRRVRVSEDQYREYVRRLEDLGGGAAVEDFDRPDARGLMIETIIEFLKSPEGRALLTEAILEDLRTPEGRALVRALEEDRPGSG